ncbi:SLATT domain-containing protein [Actinobacillus equuli subsp. equuli]|uniref:SLATT domain-containing protein n=1 Tax=Actinobacillus equuli TaxID=718 RepID=UPI0024416802|nr:SLATT domain-containing protein [Actinobacillus equuli]WGE55717.1 SLATT domain-containing protein [Actinobacillus equuli subsp. equuli]
MSNIKNVVEQKFLKSLEITIDSRFEAGKRLKRLSKISFITTTIISLGLILIPLLSSAGHNFVFSNETINIFQIFLAVCVLVFSVATSTAQYEVRSKDFFQCADKLKVICQEFKLEQISNSEKLDLKEFEKKYRDALDGTENHEDIDYIKANMIRKKKENIDDEKLWKKPNYFIPIFFMYFSPIFLSLLELLFILDMLGITTFLSILHRK